MSMLTPPGMGGKYKVSGNAYLPERRRRGRRVVVGTAALAGLAVLGWGTLELVDAFRGGQPAANAAANPCPPSQPAPPTKPLPKPGAITVNVYNATPRTGLAKQTAQALERRGFRIGKVANAPAVYDKKVKESALLIGGHATKPALTVLGAHIAGERVDTDRRQSTSIDLVIGTGYRRLDTVAAAARAIRAGTAPTGEESAAPGSRSASGQKAKTRGDADQNAGGTGEDRGGEKDRGGRKSGC